MNIVDYKNCKDIKKINDGVLFVTYMLLISKSYNIFI